MSSFGCFPATEFLFSEYCIFCDSTPQNADCGNCGPRGQDCLYCYPCATPFSIVYDLISCPFRLSHHLCCSKSSVDADTNEGN